MSVAEVSANIDLRETTLMKIMNYYVKKDVVTVVGKGKSTPSPVFLMFRFIGMTDSHVTLILLYTAFNCLLCCMGAKRVY